MEGGDVSTCPIPIGYHEDIREEEPCGARILDPENTEGPCAECGHGRKMHGPVSGSCFKCKHPDMGDTFPKPNHEHAYVPPLPVCEAGHVQPREEART